MNFIQLHLQPTVMILKVHLAIAIASVITGSLSAIFPFLGIVALLLMVLWVVAWLLIWDRLKFCFKMRRIPDAFLEYFGQHLTLSTLGLANDYQTIVTAKLNEAAKDIDRARQSWKKMSLRERNAYWTEEYYLYPSLDRLQDMQFVAGWAGFNPTPFYKPSIYALDHVFLVMEQEAA